MVFGPKPSRITGFTHLGETGVDEQAAYILGYPGGGLASLTCAVRTETTQGARIDGTEGRTEIPSPFGKTTHALLTAGERTETIEAPHKANGYEYEAMEVGRCLRAGLKQSPIVTLDESLALMGVLDQVRGQFGLTYPIDG
jgi:predicted dehydrogenase